MGVRILLSNALSEDRSSIQCEVEPGEKISGIIDTAVGYWGLDKDGKYNVKCRRELIPPDEIISNTSIKEGDRLVVVDPEVWSANLEKVKNWIAENLDAASGELKLDRSTEFGNKVTTYLIQNSQKADVRYEIVFKKGEIDSYRPM